MQYRMDSADMMWNVIKKDEGDTKKIWMNFVKDQKIEKSNLTIREE